MATKRWDKKNIIYNYISFWICPYFELPGLCPYHTFVYVCQFEICGTTKMANRFSCRRPNNRLIVLNFSVLVNVESASRIFGILVWRADHGYFTAFGIWF